MQTRPTQLDPAMVEDGDTIDMLMSVFEGLVQWDEHNQLVPNIARSWDISPDGKTYTFHLADGVRFHNGRTLTAADFVYSITRGLSPSLHSTTAPTYLNDIVGGEDVRTGKSATLAGIKAVDDKTLQIQIDAPRAYFLAKLTYPTAYAVCKEVIEANNGQFNEKTMVGTGPFRVLTCRPDYKIVLGANKAYHGPKPILSGVERPVMTDSNTRQNAYEGGQLDFVDVQRGDLDRVRQDPTLSKQLHEFPRAAIWYLALNQQAFEPFKKKDVRRAFAYAIDKDELIRLAFKGTVQKANGIIPPGVPGYDAAFQGIPYDPAKAKALLAAAGYPGGKGFPRLEISFRQGYQYISDSVMSIRNSLQRNLGIEVTARQVEWGQFLNERNQGTMPCYHLRWSADYLDPQDFLSLMLHTGAKENTLGYSNPQFDRLCDRADVEQNPQRRAALYHQAEQVAVNDVPWVCIYFQHDIELHKPYVHGTRDCLMGHLPPITVSVTR